MPRWPLFAVFLISACFAAEPSGDIARIGLAAGTTRVERTAAAVEWFRVAAAGGKESLLNWDSLSDEERNDALASIAYSKEDPELRQKAIRRLARVSPSADKDGRALAALAGVAVMEGDGSMRDLARKALAARDDKRTANVLFAGLRLEDPMLQQNVVAAMKEIGGPRIFEVIVEHWKETWGPGPRDNVFIGQQRSYIADYDVSGSSYDPVVKTFMTGVVLDAKVVKVEADLYYVWIREVTGERRLPNDPVAWERWIAKESPRLVKEAEKLRDQAAKKTFADSLAVRFTAQPEPWMRFCQKGHFRETAQSLPARRT